MTRGRVATAKRLDTAQTNGGEDPLVVYFDDIGLVRDLLGHYDANLAVLEERLGIEAVVNGNAVALRGTDEACAAAKVRSRTSLQPALPKARLSVLATWRAPSVMPLLPV